MIIILHPCELIHVKRSPCENQILKYVTRKSPQQEGEDINMGGIRQEGKNKEIVQECNYPAISAGNCANKHAYDSSPRQRDIADDGLLKFLVQGGRISANISEKQNTRMQ
jgi:hypothetical protein